MCCVERKLLPFTNKQLIKIFVAALILFSNTPIISTMNLVLSGNAFFSSSHRVLKIGNNLVCSFCLETYKKGLLLNYFAKSSKI